MSCPEPFPSTWRNPERHLSELLSNPYYAVLATLHGVVQSASYSVFSAAGIESLPLPITTHSVSSPAGLGSDSIPVMTKLFGQDVYLSDSGQFLLELGVRLRPDIQGVWYSMPSFRGEDPDSRHLNEFSHMEAEVRGNLGDVIDLVNNLIMIISRMVLAKMAGRIAEYAKRLRHLERMADEYRAPLIDYSEAVGRLSGTATALKPHPAGFTLITATGERKLIEHFGGPVWVCHPPIMAAPFYQGREPDGKSASAADLLLGIGEVVGAGARQTSADDIIEALLSREIPSADYGWYLAMKEQMPLKTAGFGMGVERLLAWIIGATDIRDVQILLRTKGFRSVP